MQQEVKHICNCPWKGCGGGECMTDLTEENNSVIEKMKKTWGFECEKFNKGQNVHNLQASEEYTEACLLAGEKIENLSQISQYLIVQYSRTAA